MTNERIPKPVKKVTLGGDCQYELVDMAYNLAIDEYEKYHQQEMRLQGEVYQAAIYAVDKKIQRLQKVYSKRIDALDRLLVCYRLGSKPSEKLMDDLDKTKEMLRRAKGK